VLRGEWQSEGIVYRDNLARFFVDVPDQPEHREYFRRFKESLKQRFQQLDIWITSHPIDVIGRRRRSGAAAEEAPEKPCLLL